MTEWQPIETAPKDASTMLLFIPDSRSQEIVFGRWDIDDQEWWQVEKESGFMLDIAPTHWMPLPEPPK